MKARIILIILLAIAVIVSVLTTVRATESDRVISNQAGTIANLEELVKRKDFGWIAADMEIDNLETTILSQNELIQQLQVKTEMLPLYKETLLYCVTYIRYLQTDMYANGLHYPEFIVDTILADGFFDDIEDQVEVFENLSD